MKNPLIIARRTLKSGKKIVRVHCLRVRLRDSCNITQPRKVTNPLKAYFEVLLNYQSWLKISTLSAPQSFRLAYFWGAEYLAVGMTFSYLSKKRVVHKLWTIFSRRACWALCLKIHNRNEGSLVSCSTSWYQVHTSLPKKKQQHKKQKQPCTLGNIHFKLCLIF